LLYTRGIHLWVIGVLTLHKGKVASVLLVSHKEEAGHHNEPVQVVRYDGTISSRVLPSEDCVEDAPSASAVEFRVAKLHKVREL